MQWWRRKYEFMRIKWNIKTAFAIKRERGDRRSVTAWIWIYVRRYAGLRSVCMMASDKITRLSNIYFWLKVRAALHSTRKQRVRGVAALRREAREFGWRAKPHVRFDFQLSFSNYALRGFLLMCSGIRIRFQWHLVLQKRILWHDQLIEGDFDMFIYNNYLFGLPPQRLLRASFDFLLKLPINIQW